GTFLSPVSPFFQERKLESVLLKPTPHLLKGEFITSQVFSIIHNQLSNASHPNKLSEYVGFANKRSSGISLRFSGSQKTFSSSLHYCQPHCIGNGEVGFRSTQSIKALTQTIRHLLQVGTQISHF